MGSNNLPDPLMPQVGGSIFHPEEGEFKVLQCLASGPFSDVFKVVQVKNDNKYAMKVEREEGNIRPVLKLDVYVLTQIKRSSKTTGFPLLVCAGRTNYYKYAVMQLVGVDLNKLRRSMPDKKFSIGTVLKLAHTTLGRIEILHDMGWLCRDVKAPNFTIGQGTDIGTVYMLDFGFARRYKDKNGNMLAPRSAAALLGTIHYAPIASHNNQEQCRRDDLESWLYMIVECTCGTLPWFHMDPMKQHKQIADVKRFVRTGGREAFFTGCPPEYDEIMDLIDNCGFMDRPNYVKIALLLERVMERNKVDFHTPYDWEVDNGNLIKRAGVIGDLGQSHMMSARLKELKQNKQDCLHRVLLNDLDENNAPQLNIKVSFSCVDPMTPRLD